MTQQIQPGTPGTILSRGRTFERVYPNGTIHYFQLVRVLDGFADSARNGAERMVSRTHECAVEVDPPKNPTSY